MTDVEVQCGNPRHPDGPWHPAAPLPPSWERRERVRQWWRRRRYGCGCPTSRERQWLTKC